MATITPNQLSALKKVQKLERGEVPWINPDDCEECEDLGWVEAQPEGGYTLTDAGRKILAGN